MTAIVSVIFASIAEDWYLNLDDFLGAWTQAILFRAKSLFKFFPLKNFIGIRLGV